jgi:hypothetical protein
MRFAFMLVSLFLFLCLPAQELSLFAEANHGGSVTYLDLEFMEDNLFVSGWHRDSGKGIIWKYDRHGSFIDSVVIEDSDSSSVMLLKKENGYLLGFGRDRRNDSIFIATRKYDAQLNLLWKKEFYINEGWIIKKIRVFPFKNRHYTFIYYAGHGASFLKFDKDYNVLNFTHNANMTISAYDPVDYTDLGFVFSTYRSHVYLDTLFNISGVEIYPYNPMIDDTPFGELIEINEDKRWFCGEYGENKTFSLMHFSDNYQTLTVYPYFGSHYEHSKYGYLRSIATNSDTSVIYATGLQTDAFPHAVAFGSAVAYPFWVARLNADSIVWYQFYNDGNYYYPINMEVGEDNCLYLACTRYEVDLSPSYSESVIFKITPGEVGIANNLQKTSISVYPNPGQNQLYIETGNNRGVFSMYNLSGQIVLSQELNGKGVLGYGRLNSREFIFTDLSIHMVM